MVVRGEIPPALSGVFKMKKSKMIIEMNPDCEDRIKNFKKLFDLGEGSMIYNRPKSDFDNATESIMKAMNLILNFKESELEPIRRSYEIIVDKIRNNDPFNQIEIDNLPKGIKPESIKKILRFAFFRYAQNLKFPDSPDIADRESLIKFVDEAERLIDDISEIIDQIEF
jgi:hypothetical protein